MLGLSRAGLEKGGVLNTPGLVGEPLLDVVHQMKTPQKYCNTKNFLTITLISSSLQWMPLDDA